MLLVLAFAPGALAQKPSLPIRIDSNFVSVRNSAVTVHVNKATGQFWIETGKSERLLFAGEDGGTSATSVRFNGTTFTNNRLRSPKSPAGTVYMPEGSAYVTDDSAYFVTDIHLPRVALRLTQKFVPMIDGDYGFIRIHSTLTNISQENISAGLQNLFDLYLSSTDLVTVTINGNTVDTETQWKAGSIPDEYRGSAAGIQMRILARLRGNGTTPPDILTVGNWRYDGYLGGPAWDYTPSGLPIRYDNAVLLQWDTEPLAPGASRTLVTDYGVDVNTGVSIACTSDTLRLNFTEDGYEPDPFLFLAHVSNTGDIANTNIQVGIILPPGLSTISGESQTRTIVGPLAPGSTIPVSWHLRADTSGTARTVSILTTVDNGYTTDTCELVLYIPPIPRYDLQTLCPDDIYLELTGDQLGYKNATFTVTAGVLNSGNARTNSVNALIDNPTILRLESERFKFLAPDALEPGDQSFATWTLTAAPQCKDTIVDIRIALQRMPFYNDTCVVRVHFPAARLDYCVPNGVRTWGTSFHSALLYNDAIDLDGTPEAILYIMCDTIAHVKVVEELTGFTYEFDVNACDMKTVVLSDSVHSLVRPITERIERRSVTITSTAPITVVAGSMRNRHSDATILLPDHALGTEYVTIGYNYTGDNEQFTVVSTGDNTDVTLTLWERSIGGIPPLVPYPLILNEHETFNVIQGAGGPIGGLTGSQISASQPVAVVTGMASGNIPGYTRSLEFRNPALCQVPPVEDAGTVYITTPFRSRHGGYTIRVVATQPGTDIMVGGTPAHLANVGNRFETQLLESTLITANKPVLVAQYTHSATWDDASNHYGDGSMVILPPADRFASCHTFPTRLGSDIEAPGSRFDSSFANLIVYQGGESMVSVNGIALADTAFKPVAGSIFSAAALALPPGVQNIGTADRRGICVVAYAFEYHDAYCFIPGYISGQPITGVDDVPAAEEASLDVFPNPARGAVRTTLRLEEQTTGTLKLYDALGRDKLTVHSGVMIPGTAHYLIDISGYPAGTYFLVLHSGQIRKSVRFSVLP